MKIAILLLCHKNPKQINILIDTLQNADIDIYIHIDKKFYDIKKDIKRSPNVVILEDNKSYDVRWATLSQVEATLALLETASREKYDYYWLCSGQDLPLVKSSAIINYLESNGKDRNYIRFFNSRNVSGSSNNYDKRNDIFYPSFIIGGALWQRILKRLYVEFTGGYSHTIHFFKRGYNGIDFYYGSQWWCLNQETIGWILNYLNEHQDYYNYFKNCSTPDESFFHSLVMASPFADQCVDYLHYIVWPEGSNSPKVLDEGDVESAISSEYLMARKFDLLSCPLAIERLLLVLDS